MDLNQFDYDLPEELIAQQPLPQRTASRLLSLRSGSDELEELHFGQLGQLLSAGDLLVVNDTRVLPARMFSRKPSGGKVEIMLERITGEKTALVMLKSNKPIKNGQELMLEDCKAVVTGREGTFFQVAFDREAASVFQQYGTVPLPPYIQRPAEEDDQERYQTVYSVNPGAVAAPTAGLHFDQTLIDQLTEKGVIWASVTLHVGAGTFQPVRHEKIESHTMHKEQIEVSVDTCEKIRQAKSIGNKVIAVGTTVVRALESAAFEGTLKPVKMDSELFIYPGFQFKVVDAMITNFHLPKSTLLMMISAFAGYERIMSAYQYAIDQQYRFFSYGDAMYLERGQ